MHKLRISSHVSIPESEIEIGAVRAQGAGGQNVNKVSSAVHLRFDIRASSLPDFYKQRLLSKGDRRITKEGIVVIKAQRFRTLEKNRDDALGRLAELIGSVAATRKARVPTKPTTGSRQRRLKEKTRQARLKALRGRVRPDGDKYSFKVILPPSVGLSAPPNGVAALAKGRAIACATRLAPKHHSSAEGGNITLKEY